MLCSNDKIKTRMLLVIIIFFIPAVIYLVIGMYNLQVIHHDEYLKKSQKRVRRTDKKLARRGSIFSANGSVLVTNVPCYNIAVDPYVIYQQDKSGKSKHKIAVVISKHLNIPFKEVLDKLAPERPVYDKNGKIVYDENGKIKMRKSQYVMIKRSVSLDNAAKLRQELKALKLSKGIILEDSYMRYYVKGSFLSTILGLTESFEDKDFGKSGVEKAMNKDLTETAEAGFYEAGGDGRRLSYGDNDEAEIKDGKNIYLTINEPLQTFVEEELDQIMEEFSPNAAYAIMVDPKTGNVLAAAQRPNFNPNDRSTLTAQSSNLRFLTDVYEPGSIIKPFTIAHALDNGIVTPNTMIDCENGYWVYMRRPLTDSHKIGVVSITEVLKQSSNIGTAKVALMLGDEAVRNNLANFGFGQKSNFILQPESKGIFHKIDSFKRDKLLVTRVAIGYGISVTPIQMIRAYCALANGGKLLPLRLIDRIEDPETGEVKEMPYKEGTMVFENPQTAETMRYILSQIPRKGGTAQKAAVPGFNVAGKTGTARKNTAQGYSNKYFASFVGFAPAEDPAFVLLVTVDEPHGRSYYGGSVAGPSFRRISEKALKYLNIDPKEVSYFTYEDEAE